MNNSIGQKQCERKEADEAVRPNKLMISQINNISVYLDQDDRDEQPAIKNLCGGLPGDFPSLAEDQYEWRSQCSDRPSVKDDPYLSPQKLLNILKYSTY